MTLYLLRHAHAGDRSRWVGDDRIRPLSDKGWRQAEAVIAQYAGHPVERVLTSPLTRCVQTVEPLAADRNLDIEEEEALAEGAPLEAFQRLARRLGDTPAVLCSHGDVISAAITDLHHRGVVGSDELRWKKGSTWILQGTPEISAATYLAPPA